MIEPLLKVDDLHIALRTANASYHPVANVRFVLRPGQAVAPLFSPRCGRPLLAPSSRCVLPRPLSRTVAWT